MGTPFGSLEFIESYLFGKGIKHRQLLGFIKDVAAAGFPREAIAMLTGAACPRLTHLLKSVEKNPSTKSWMQEMDLAHLETWLHCIGKLDGHNKQGDFGYLAGFTTVLWGYGSDLANPLC
jgi:hypothetical protein